MNNWTGASSRLDCSFWSTRLLCHFATFDVHQSISYFLLLLLFLFFLAGVPLDLRLWEACRDCINRKWDETMMRPVGWSIELTTKTVTVVLLLLLLLAIQLCQSQGNNNSNNNNNIISLSTVWQVFQLWRRERRDFYCLLLLWEIQIHPLLKSLSDYVIVIIILCIHGAFFKNTRIETGTQGVDNRCFLIGGGSAETFFVSENATVGSVIGKYKLDYINKTISLWRTPALNHHRHHHHRQSLLVSFLFLLIFVCV